MSVEGAGTTERLSFQIGNVANMAGILGTMLFLWPVLLIGGVLYFGRNFLLAWIKSRAVFGFDKELSRLRGEISRSETRLRDELEASQKA